MAFALRPLLPWTGPPLRVLDLGAGLGASALGVYAVLPVARATLVDSDPAALKIAASLLDDPPVTHVADASAFTPRSGEGPWDLIVASQVLSELDPLPAGAGEAAQLRRAERHGDLVDRWMSWLSPSGALLLVEPALSDRSRHLHAVRDRLRTSWPPLAPCTHTSVCPARAIPGEWCHERRLLQLEPEVEAVARYAGLARESLDFSYLLLTRDRRTAPGAATHRVVSDRLDTRGKSEFFLCGAFAGGAMDRRKVQRLERHRTPANAAWDRLKRGDRVAIPELELRVTPETTVEPCDG